MSDSVTKHRTEGNTFFREKKFFDACRCYQSAISECPESDKSQLSILYTNLSASQLQIEKLNEAFESASKAIELDPNNAKAYYRHGLALSNSLDFKGAYNSYLAAAKIQPNEKFWRNLMEDAKQQLYKLKLREAMSSDDLHSQSKKVASHDATSDTTPIPEFDISYARNLMAEMAKDKRPPAAVVRAMLAKMKEMNKAMPNIVKIEHKGAIRVVGDTHGQYQDLRHIFEKYGEPSTESPYLFNGDFVDRGSMGLEIVLALFAWKLANPACIFMNRGNQYVFFLRRLSSFPSSSFQSLFSFFSFLFRNVFFFCECFTQKKIFFFFNSIKKQRYISSKNSNSKIILI
ncbi:protein phosphatase-1 [Tritrichomonas foetus]|uniref:Protein phosphatase-1 n=1 Tax=Tritrichomonas foetus TaxID=1144522 RepID=A0A1J4J5L5_9EUKA|nr:protein phosphatase-1 [Tritrichomonas foetus]|eukprot:OHS92931.1 protein phosphatase-1 [Tritrichomonas foetus]